MLKDSQEGNNHNVDMLVGDIYGFGQSRFGLNDTAIASSFGKVFKRKFQQSTGNFTKGDISRSLLVMLR